MWVGALWGNSCCLLPAGPPAWSSSPVLPSCRLPAQLEVAPLCCTAAYLVPLSLAFDSMTGSHFTWFNAANVAGSEWGFICLPAGLPPPLQPPQHCRHACRRRSSTVAMLAAAAAALSPCLSARRPTCSCHPARVHPEHPYPDLLSHWPGRHPARLPPLSPPMRFALPSSLLLQPLSTWSTSCLASTPDSSSLATSSRRWSWRCALHWLCCAVLCCAVLCWAFLANSAAAQACSGIAPVSAGSALPLAYT